MFFKLLGRLLRVGYRWLRFHLLDPARNQVTILTTIFFDGKNASFWMSESDYIILSSLNATIRLFRSDSWKPFSQAQNF
ncbi:hypothetical protein DFA_07159 [Cavenderia fasciculata]|uniref:Uncharacterized protein n=1 Tax=Cavenderia fasciculata TaxID=261658 RepID=F4PVM9_CACFS|nr:uncharacterized protein DFA_07159 [Cavenderia fasciculata]EGG20043.1 hypothetical protein DFA_07159 [Cavenderia fasciculata]|eukprot:XP_004367026.1 hypothetical protein DFA_07159 [Cavenderia fasciculata]